MRDKLIFLLLAGAFTVLAIDIRYEHRNVISYESSGWIPIVFSIAAAVACLAAAALNGKGKGVLVSILALGPVVAGFGLYFHTREYPGALAALIRTSIPGGTQLIAAPKPEDTPGRGDPPLVAPTSMAGMSLIGIVALLYQKPEGGSSKKSESKKK